MIDFDDLRQARVAELERRAAEQMAAWEAGGRPIPLEKAGEELGPLVTPTADLMDDDEADDDDPGPLVPEVDLREIQTLTRRWAEMRAKTEERLAVVRELGKDCTAKQIVAALTETGDPVKESLAYYLRQVAFGATKPKKLGADHAWVQDDQAGYAEHQAAKNGHSRLRLADPDNDAPEQTHTAPPDATVYAEGDPTALDLLMELLDKIKALGGLRKTLGLLAKLEEAVT